MFQVPTKIYLNFNKITKIGRLGLNVLFRPNLNLQLLKTTVLKHFMATELSTYIQL